MQRGGVTPLRGSFGCTSRPLEVLPSAGSIGPGLYYILCGVYHVRGCVFLPRCNTDVAACSSCVLCALVRGPLRMCRKRDGVCASFANNVVAMGCCDENHLLALQLFCT